MSLLSLTLTTQVAVGQSATSIFGIARDDGGPAGSVDGPSVSSASTTNWGYSYDSLLVDLSEWERSPFVDIQRAGESVQGRGLWLVTVTDTVEAIIPRFRVTMHTRTHPSEVESLFATREVIRILIGNTPFAARLRTMCIFNIMPMYNPDGVELGYARQNANGVDLERGWDTPSPQPEVATLRQVFETYMASESPVRIALNMHADGSSSSRYFVYHHENGTSVQYAEDERTFIRSVRSYWPQGIRDWDGFISWTTHTPTYYPESWFWLNYGEAVLALTYEEVRTQNASEFELSASALLNGILDYLGSIDPVSFRHPAVAAGKVVLYQNYPNPFSLTTTISYELPSRAAVSLKVYDVLGRSVRVLSSGIQPAGRHDASFDVAGLPNGIYLYQLRAGAYSEAKRMTVVM